MRTFSIGFIVSIYLLVDTSALSGRILRRKKDGESKRRLSFVATPKNKPFKFTAPPGHVCKLVANMIPITKSDEVKVSPETTGEGTVEVIYNGDPLDQEGCFSLVAKLRGYTMNFSESRISLNSDKVCLLSSRQKPKFLGGDVSKFEELAIFTDRNGNGEVRYDNICLGNYGTIEQVFGTTVRIGFDWDGQSTEGTLCGAFNLECKKDTPPKNTGEPRVRQREEKTY